MVRSGSDNESEGLEGEETTKERGARLLRDPGIISKYVNRGGNHWLVA